MTIPHNSALEFANGVVRAITRPYMQLYPDCKPSTIPGNVSTTATFSEILVFLNMLKGGRRDAVIWRHLKGRFENIGNLGALPYSEFVPDTSHH
jgi:hypothetical protein